MYIYIYIFIYIKIPITKIIFLTKKKERNYNILTYILHLAPHLFPEYYLFKYNTELEFGKELIQLIARKMMENNN